MKIKTVWEYSEKTEALRLLHDAHQVAVGFYRINNFIVLPSLKSTSAVNYATLPDLDYNKIPRFWDKVKNVDITTLPVKAEPELLSETLKLLSHANLPKVQFNSLQKMWGKVQNEIITAIYKILPAKKYSIKKIRIYPTAFGTICSFNWTDKSGEVVMYVRQDAGIATIVEAIITSLTRKDIYNKLNGMWQESEIITDFLITQSALAPVIAKYDTKAYLPTIKGVRTKQQAKLLTESEAFYKKLGLCEGQKIFGLNGLTPEINKKPLENLSVTEKAVLKLLIQKSGGVASFDEIANELFEDDQRFSLYAITKRIERLRSKLEANGISGSYIQTLRGKGYLLKN